MDKVVCPRCGSEYLIRDGNNNGLQGYRCKTCRKKFTFGKYEPLIKNVKERKITKTKFDVKKYIEEKIEQAEEENHVLLSKENIELLNNLKKNDNFNILKLKKTSDNEDSNVVTEIAKRIAKFNRSKIENNLMENLFRHDEKLDALIMKILIYSDWGIEVLVNYINTDEHSMTKYNFNVIGKHMAIRIEKTWEVMKKYIKNFKTKDCKLTITRYINYISKIEYKRLKSIMDYDEIIEIYLDNNIKKKFVGTRITDSDYMRNEDEFYYSMSKIVEKISKAELKEDDYLSQYNYSIFTESNIEYVFNSYRRYLTKEGVQEIGYKIEEFWKRYKQYQYKKTNAEYNCLIDEYTQYIYGKLLSLGEEKFYNLFKDDGWTHNQSLKELIFRCRINNEETERMGLKIIEKLRQNPLKQYDYIEKGIFGNLLYYLSNEALEILIKRIDGNVEVTQSIAFDCALGIVEKIYGDFYNLNSDYSIMRSRKGLYWEYLIGGLLPEFYDNILKHPKLSNNKIPDYAIEKTQNKELAIIIECKLVLGFRELKETIEKYNKYCSNIEFYCYENQIDENVIASDEYKELMSNVNDNFQYSIIDFDMLYNKTSKNYILKNFEKNIKNMTRKTLLEEKICLNFDKEKSEKLIYILDKIYKESELF